MDTLPRHEAETVDNHLIDSSRRNRKTDER